MSHRRRWWSVEYSVFKVGASVTFYFDTKARAVQFATRQPHGDWVVWRHGPFNRNKKLTAIGGNFDDWPEDV
jgi:hypothetical protein